MDAIRTGAPLVACVKDRVTLETDPGFSSVTPAKDGAHLLAQVEHDDVLRVFDARTWKETLHLEDVVDAASMKGGLAIVNHRGGTSALWDLAAEAPRIAKIPAVAAVSTEGTAAFWREGRALVLATPDVVRVPIDTTEKLTLAELPRGAYLAAAPSGRRWVIDAAAGKVRRSFTIPGARTVHLALPDRSAALVDVGSYISGVGEMFFDPTRPPVLVPLAGTEAPKPLAGPGCATSIVLAVSDDGTLALTRAREAWCLFDVASRKLLGRLAADDEPLSFGPQLADGGTFVGPNVVVAGVAGSFSRLRVDRTRPDPLYDRERVGRLLLPRSNEGAFPGADPPLVAAPTTKAWVGGGRARIVEVRSDGSIEPLKLPIDGERLGRSGPELDPRAERLVGAEGLDHVWSCLLSPAPGAGGCKDLPLGGAYELSPDGTWAAGPAVVGRRSWTSPAFVHRTGALTAVAVADARPLLVRHAPGFDAVAFTSETELALLGEDGVLLTCALEGGGCRRMGRVPDAAVLGTDPGHLAITDAEGGVVSTPELAAAPRAETVLPPAPHLRMREGRVLFHVGRGLVVEPRGEVLRWKDAASGAVVREVPVDGRALLSASAARLAYLTAKELAVLELATGAKTFTKSVGVGGYAPFGAIALSADGKRVVLAADRTVRLFDVEGGRELARWPLAEPYRGAVGITPDGARVAVAVESSRVERADRTYSDPADVALLLMDAASKKVERVPLGRVGARGAGGLAEIAMTASGWVALAFGEGRGVLVRPAQAEVYDLARDAADDGVWLRGTRGSASAFAYAYLGRPTAGGLHCRMGERVLPAAACVPAFCAPR